MSTTNSLWWRNRKDQGLDDHVVMVEEGEQPLTKTASGTGSSFSAKMRHAADATIRGVQAAGEATRDVTMRGVHAAGEAGAVVKEKAIVAGQEVRTVSSNATAAASNALKQNNLLHGGTNSTHDSQSESEDPKPKQAPGSKVHPFPTFGVPIENTLKDHNTGLWVREIPLVVHDMISYVLANNLVREEGIFRLSGRLIEINAIKDVYDTGAPVDLDTITEPHSAPSLLKLFLRELPEPILTIPLLPEFEALTKADYNEKTTQALIGLLPAVSKLVLAEIFDLLRIIVSHANVNLMCKSNLAIIFVPALSISYELFYFFFDHPQILAMYPTLSKQYLKNGGSLQIVPLASKSIPGPPLQLGVRPKVGPAFGSAPPGPARDLPASPRQAHTHPSSAKETPNIAPSRSLPSPLLHDISTPPPQRNTPPPPGFLTGPPPRDIPAQPPTQSCPPQDFPLPLTGPPPRDNPAQPPTQSGPPRDFPLPIRSGPPRDSPPSLSQSAPLPSGPVRECPSPLSQSGHSPLRSNILIHSEPTPPSASPLGTPPGTPPSHHATQQALNDCFLNIKVSHPINHISQEPGRETPPRFGTPTTSRVLPKVTPQMAESASVQRLPAQPSPNFSPHPVHTQSDPQTQSNPPQHFSFHASTSNQTHQYVNEPGGSIDGQPVPQPQAPLKSSNPFRR